MADRHEVRVDFKAVGNKNLEIALKQLAASQTLLRRGVKAYEAELKRLNLQQRKILDELMDIDDDKQYFLYLQPILMVSYLSLIGYKTFSIHLY